MAMVRVLVLRAAGINCDEETAFAWEAAGAKPERLHVKRLIERPSLLASCQVLTIPGGFSYGDDIASGKILAVQLVHHLGEPIQRFVERGGLILGICNGFQVLVRMGMLPGVDCGLPVTLTHNDSGRYEDRWVCLRAEDCGSVFLQPGETLHLPVAHAEGKFLPAGGEAGLSVLETRRRVALRYVDADGGTCNYPANPNGSVGNVAGLTDGTGRVLGLMPHPERNLAATHPPCWTRGSGVGGEGRRVFARAVAWFA